MRAGLPCRHFSNHQGQLEVTFLALMGEFHNHASLQTIPGRILLPAFLFVCFLKECSCWGTPGTWLARSGRCCFTGSQWLDECVFVSACFPWNIIHLSVPSEIWNCRLLNKKTYCRNCRSIWRICHICPCEMGHQASCTVIQISPTSFSEGGWLLGRSSAGIAESWSLTGASWWVFPSAVLLQLTSNPAESPSASCWKVIPSDTSHSMDQTDWRKPASWKSDT